MVHLFYYYLYYEIINVDIFLLIFDFFYYFIIFYYSNIINNIIINNKIFIDMKTIKKLKPARGRPAYSWPHIKSFIFTLKSLDLKHFIELVLKQMSGKMFHTGTTRLIK